MTATMKRRDFITLLGGVAGGGGCAAVGADATHSPPASKQQISPILIADSVTPAISHQKDGKPRAVYAGWGDAKVVEPSEIVEFRASWGGCYPPLRTKDPPPFSPATGAAHVHRTVHFAPSFLISLRNEGGRLHLNVMPWSDSSTAGNLAGLPLRRAAATYSPNAAPGESKSGLATAKGGHGLTLSSATSVSGRAMSSRAISGG